MRPAGQLITLDVRRRVLAAAIFAVAAATAAPRAQSFPNTLEVDGRPLVLNGVGVKSTLVGLVRLYRIALYLTRRSSDPLEIAAMTPRALAIEMLHETAGREIPRTWMTRLDPVLDARERRVLRDAYGRLEAGDHVEISYTPRSDSRVTINGREVIRKRGPALMDAFLDEWVGRHPTSTQIKAALLGASF